MRLTIRVHDIHPVGPLRQHTEQRAYAALSRFGHEIGSAVVRFSDVNGTKGGVDCRCDVHVRGPRIGSLTVRELSRDPRVGSDLSLARMARLVRRQLDRLRESRYAGLRVNASS